MATLKIPRETVEKLECVVSSDVDPTASPVSFAFVQGTDRPSTWTPGVWDGDYSGGRATAVTPTIGSANSGATVELDVGTWQAYVQVQDNPEVPVRTCGRISLT